MLYEFKKQMQIDFEEMIQERPPIVQSQKHSRIADIRYVLKNSHIIALLKQRGDCIARGDFKQQWKVQSDIN